VPFKPDPTRAEPGKLGPGIPEDFSHCLPYRYGFGVKADNPVEYDLTETYQFVELCMKLGVKLLDLSAGSPYYNPHIQRPASYPPSDGYQPAHDPLIDVARQINVVRQIKEHLTLLAQRQPGVAVPIVIGTAYSYLQEYLPHVAQYAVRQGWTDMVGLGRVVLSYPEMLADATTKGALATRFNCRTFSDCTTGPRNGLISGCYPLDDYYKAKPEYHQLKQIKKSAGV
jgi:2,4-dienoyl-CoA reductase-like NADH-dependent reductase (Old Yellow Enzyme family)